jgi:multimeric flavodoxin WrbA
VKVIGIVASPRAGGNTEQLMKIALDEISKQGIEVELIHLRDKEIKPCNYCRSCEIEHGSPLPKGQFGNCAIKDDFDPVFQKMVEADGILLGCPVYFSSTPAKLKALLTRAGMLSEGREKVGGPILPGWPLKRGPGIFRRKVGGAIVVTRRAGCNFTLAELLLWFMINNMIVPGSTYWTVALSGELGREEPGELAKNVVEIDLEGVFTIKVLAQNVAWLLKKIKK